MAVEIETTVDVGNEDTKAIGDKTYSESFEQSEVAYTVVSTMGGQVCANCRWFESYSSYDPCRIVRNNDPLPIVSGGYCDQWAMRPEADIILSEIMGEVAEIENGIQTGTMSAKGLLGQVWESKSIQPILDYVDKAVNPRLLPSALPQSGFKSFGNNQWIAWYTNNFEDKEGEWFADKAIATFVKRVNDGLLELPELWYYHINGTRAGAATKLFHVGHFLIALGKWDNKDENAKVAPLQKWVKNTDIRLSHGFFYDPKTKIKGIYNDFATFEITLLDNGIEANPYTPFHSVKINEVDKIMEVTQVQKDALHKVFDKDMADEIINSADSGGKSLDTAGVAYKTSQADKEVSGETTLILGALGALNEKIKAIETRAAHIDDEDDEDDEDKDKGKSLSDDSIALIQSFDSDMTTLTTAVRAMEQRMEKFMKMTPRASKSAQTIIADTDPHANHIHEQNYKGGLASEGLIGRAMKGAATLNGAVPNEDDIPKPPNVK